VNRIVLLTPADVAARLNLKKLDGVYALIHGGQLIATNVAAGSGRPTWRIAAEALDAFLAARRAVPVPKPDRRRRRRQLGNVTEYF